MTASWIVVVVVDMDSMQKVVDVHFVLVRSLEHEFLKSYYLYINIDHLGISRKELT
jgi:hypothetical protein